MAALQLMITQAGLDALVDAQDGATDPIRVVEVGLTTTAFVTAPTLTALPGEFKRVAAVSGESVSETVIHMTIQDTSVETYDLRGIGLYLEDGTLFAVYGQATPIFSKVSIAFFLMAFDIAFGNGVAGDIEFGDASFLLPPATETVKGVAEIATETEAAAGTDDERIITPAKLKHVLALLSAAIGNDFATLIARTITGGGLVNGGGNLSASRVLTVVAALASDVATGTASDKAITPAALSGLARSLAQSGYATIPGCGGLIAQWGRFSAAANSITATLFPINFPTACYVVIPAGGVNGGADSQDNPPVLIESTISASGFSVFSADDSSAGQCFIALGK